jgi:3-dehydroquinate dehydratase-2
MSNVAKRGITCVLAPVATGVVFGFGIRSYLIGLDAMLGLLRAPQASHAA